MLLLSFPHGALVSAEGERDPEIGCHEGGGGVEFTKEIGYCAASESLSPFQKSGKN